MTSGGNGCVIMTWLYVTTHFNGLTASSTKNCRPNVARKQDPELPIAIDRGSDNCAIVTECQNGVGSRVDRTKRILASLATTGAWRLFCGTTNGNGIHMEIRCATAN